MAQTKSNSEKGQFKISVNISGKDIVERTGTFKAENRYLLDGESPYWSEDHWADDIMSVIENEIRRRYTDVSVFKKRRYLVNVLDGPREGGV